MLTCNNAGQHFLWHYFVNSIFYRLSGFYSLCMKWGMIKCAMSRLYALQNSTANRVIHQ